jgi:Zn-dependent M28 family amino/carboxypeptidase
VNFGPRVISSKAWDNCSKYLTNKLESYNAKVIVQQAPITTYDQKNHTLRNIIGSYSPEKNNRIALFAHWDSRHVADYDTINTTQPILGANDGGSGVGVLLEIARNLDLKNPKIGVDIIFFDAEDYGQPENSKFPIMNDSWCLGSQYWSKNPHKQNYFAKYGILLDMVGGKDAEFWQESISSYYASNIIKKVWDVAHNIGYSNFFIYKNSPQIMDDHYYVNTIAGIPTIDIIEYDPFSKTNFNKHWHTHADNMNNVDRKTLKAVGQTVMDVIYSE